MKKIGKQTILENSIYFVGWFFVFLTPIMDSKMSGEASVQWRMVFRAWLVLLPFFLFFIFHNFFTTPLYFFKKKYVKYAIFNVLALIFIFSVYPKVLREGMNFPGKNSPEMNIYPKPEFDKKLPPDFQKMPPDGFKAVKPNGFPEKRFGKKPIIDIRAVDSFFLSILIAILISGFNLSVKLFLRLMDEQQKQTELRNNSLMIELENLKWQLNPHFFMNMLNNIHALIDLDKDKAKETIIGFSKLMRYVLYDANQPNISLLKEVIFIKNYIELMKIRYTKNVSIKVNLPVVVPDVKIPPLLFVSFIENAFKHGVSYRNKSFVNLSLTILEHKIVYEVSNSLWTNNEEEKEGIGLQNVTKRLNLLYGDRYVINVSKTEKEYSVILIIPV